MFKAQVLRRNFSLFNRVPYSRIAHSAACDGHETVTIQRYRIQKPFFSKSRLIGTLASTITIYGLLSYLGSRIEARQNEERGVEPGQKVHTIQAGDKDDDQILLFLPTGFSRAKPLRYYRGSDPEWQEFMKLTRDRQRVMKIRDDFTSQVRNFVAKHPPFVSRLGRIDEKKGKVWIEFKFPDGPPVEYERPGIELTEHLEWRRTTHPVESKHHHLLERAFSPTTTAGVLLKDTLAKMGSSWKSFKAYLGWEEGSGPDTVQQMMQRIGTDPQVPSKPAGNSSRTASQPSSSSPANDTVPTSVSADLAKDLRHMFPGSKELTLDLAQFRDDYRRKAQPPKMIVPPGSFYVFAVIDVHGDRARLTLTVAAVYDLRQGKFAGMRLTVFNLTDYKQFPKGGP